MKKISILLVIVMLVSSLSAFAKVRIYSGTDELTKSEGTNFKVESVNGFAGKPNSDMVYKITGKGTTSSSNYIDPYLRAFESNGTVEYSLLFEDTASVHTISLVNQNKTGDAPDGYLNNILKFSPEYSHIKYNSDNVDKLANSEPFSFEAGKWYRIAIDYTYTSGQTYGVFDLYIDGNKIGSVKFNSPYGVRRLSLGCSKKSDDSSSVIYIDNMTSYKETDEDFNIAKTEPSQITYTESTITLTDGTYVVPAGFTVKDFKDSIKTTDSDDVVRIFDSSFTNELQDTETIKNAVVVVAAKNGRDYETAYSYYVVNADVSNEPVLESDVYDLSGETINVMPYTTVETFTKNVTVKAGYSLSISCGGVPCEESDVLSGECNVIVIDSSTHDASITYGISVNAKSISDNFDMQSQKMYSGGTTTDGNYTFAGPTLNQGYAPKDYAYIEALNVPGKGKVIHSYSNGSHSAESGYKHMNLMSKIKPNKAALGSKFAFHVQVMLPKSNDTYATLANYKTDAGEDMKTQVLLQFKDGTITLLGSTVGVYETGDWTDVLLICDASNGSVVSYVNGVLSAQTTIKKLEEFDYFTQVRPVHHNYQSGKIVESYLACFEMFGIGSLCNKIITDNSTILLSDKFNVTDKTINGFINMTVADVKSTSNITAGAELCIYTKSGDVVNNTAKVESGMLAVVKSPSGAVEDVYTFGAEHCHIGEIEILVNGGANFEKFVSGTITAQVDAENYCDTLYPITVAIAHYSDGTMTDIDFTSTELEKGSHKVSAELEIADSKESFIKAFVFDSISKITPLKNEIYMEAFSADSIEDVRILYPGYVEKAVTFSYDDLVSNDKKLIGIFNDNGIKGTFNLITNRFDGYENSLLLNIYNGHEIASHSYSHPRMYITKDTVIDGDTYSPLTYDEVVGDIQKAQDDIKNLTGSEPIGFAWPYARASSRKDYNEILEYMHNSGIRYTRSVTNSRSFDLPDNWMEWDPTCHHDDAAKYTEDFINLAEDGTLKLLYIWGHSYEFTTSDIMDWDGITEVCEALGAESSIWKATNADIYNYVEATKLLTVDYDNGTITNNSTSDIYIAVNSVNICIPAKSQFTIK